MALIQDTLVQLAQLLLVLLLAPLLTGYVRKVKAHLLRRRGPPLVQPYRDLLRLLRKEVVLADSASWLFRVAPYLVFAAMWVAAALIPTFATGLLFSWSADMIAIVALLGTARFFLALAGAQAQSVLTDPCIVSIRESLDQFMQLCQPGGIYQVNFRGGRSGNEQVFLDRRAEKVSVL